MIVKIQEWRERDLRIEWEKVLVTRNKQKAIVKIQVFGKSDDDLSFIIEMTGDEAEKIEELVNE